MVRTVTIVLEWENALLAGLDRSRRVLDQLNAQVSAFAAAHGASFDLLVTFNPEDVDPAIPQKVVSAHIDVARWGGRMAYLQAPGKHYFEQKNLGAEQAASEIVLFFDSDVIPEDGWLQHVLSLFDDPKTEVVAGYTYLGCRTLLERCFALFWIFPPKQLRAEVAETPLFYANNVAFRRDVFLANAFPVAESYRGQGVEVARQLRSKGHRILRHGEAWVNHPAPNGLGHAMKRAIAHGHDAVYWNRRRKRGWLTTSPLGALGRFLRSPVGMARRAFGRRRALRAHLPMVLLAVAAGITFRFVVMLSEFVAFVSPAVIRRNVSL
jgi:hypothetical protein